jgi:toxin ParE1/3/4
MGKAIRAPRAKIDLVNIADYIARDNLRAAIKLTDEIDAAVDRLAQYPGMGPQRNELGRGLRSYPVGNYLIFYRIIDEGVEVVRIIDGRRKLRRALREP